MIKAWKQWKTRTDLPGRTFLKFYIWDRIIIRPRRRARHKRNKTSAKPKRHKLRRLQRWANNKFIFRVCEKFEDYAS